MTGERNEIGLAIIGCGTIGRIRAEIARDYPGVGWLGLCDIKEDLGKKLAEDANADFFTTNYEELVKRPEVNAVIISTDENHHMMPTLAAVEQGHHLFIEKPLATDVKESQRVLDAIESAGVDAVVGYTNRFRRRFLTIKERLNTGQIGQVTCAASKGGVAGMALPMARELGKFGIRVVTIAPGVFSTPMMQAAPDAVREALESHAIFPRRLGLADEYGLFASQIFENPMLNGSVLRLDGAIRMPPK